MNRARVRDFVSMIKFKVVMLSTFSGVTGYIMATHANSSGYLKLFVFASVLFLLAAGAAALNEYQEYRFDRIMERTRQRPIPSGILEPGFVLTISIGLIFFGLVGMVVVFGVLPGLIGLVTVIFYNGVYTYLKRVTAYAAVPGALIGALPPAIGWTAGNGNPFSPVLSVLMLFFYLWQIPHFWLLVSLYSRDYSRAGFPSISDEFTPPQLSRMIFTWIIATVCCVMMFPLFGIFNHIVSRSLSVLTGLAVAGISIPLLMEKTESDKVFRRTFRSINIFAFLMMLILICEYKCF